MTLATSFLGLSYEALWEPLRSTVIHCHIMTSEQHILKFRGTLLILPKEWCTTELHLVKSVFIDQETSINNANNSYVCTKQVHCVYLILLINNFTNAEKYELSLTTNVQRLWLELFWLPCSLLIISQSVYNILWTFWQVLSDGMRHLFPCSLKNFLVLPILNLLIN